MAFIWQDSKTHSWFLDYTPPGGKRTRKLIGKSKQAAQLALKEIEYQLAFDRAGVSTPDITLGDFCGRYTQVTKPAIRPRSWRRYEAILAHLNTFLGPDCSGLKLQQLRREQIEQYVAWRRAGHGAFTKRKLSEIKPAKSKTINTELDMLASMFNKAVDWKYLAQNPVRSISRLREDDRKPFRFFSTEEIELLRLVADLLDQKMPRRQIDEQVKAFFKEHPELSAANDSRAIKADDEQPIKRVNSWPPNGRVIIDFLLMTGSRENELLNLHWENVDLKRGIVAYRRRDDWVPKGSEREIALKPELLAKLKILRQKSQIQHVFTDLDSQPIAPRTFERAIQKLIVISRIPRATLHDFRHTFASHLAMAGVPLPTIQQLLGHKDIQTVMIYAHLSPSHLHQSVSALPY